MTRQEAIEKERDGDRQREREREEKPKTERNTKSRQKIANGNACPMSVRQSQGNRKVNGRVVAAFFT